MAIQKSIVARNAELDALAPLANNGYIRIYSGSIPATPETAASGTLLAELRFGATAFGAAASGVITANAITEDSSANNTGTAGYYRALESDGTTALWDGTVGTSGADLNLNSTNIQALVKSESSSPVVSSSFSNSTSNTSSSNTSPSQSNDLIDTNAPLQQQRPTSQPKNLLNEIKSSSTAPNDSARVSDI